MFTADSFVRSKGLLPGLVPWGWGKGGEGCGTLNFVCYIGWAPAPSVYPQKYTVYKPYQKISEASNILHKIFPLLSFYKSVVFIYFFSTMIVLVICALNSFQQ